MNIAAPGDDVYTENLQRIIRDHFGPTAEVFPVFNGTGANVVSLQAITDRWGAVRAPGRSHPMRDRSATSSRS